MIVLENIEHTFWTEIATLFWKRGGRTLLVIFVNAPSAVSEMFKIYLKHFKYRKFRMYWEKFAVLWRRVPEARRPGGWESEPRGWNALATLINQNFDQIFLLRKYTCHVSATHSFTPGTLTPLLHRGSALLPAIDASSTVTPDILIRSRKLI